jgi:N-acyl-D-amino-acid deacylase
MARPPRPSTPNAKHAKSAKKDFSAAVAAFAFFGLFVTAPAPRAQVGGRASTIVGGEVADGTGAALRRANVRVVDDRIVGVGPDVKPLAGDTVIDAKGLLVAPGFIDIHNHSAHELASEPAATSQVAQGITTAVLGPDGSSPWPIGAYLEERRSSPASVNVAVMVGHATVRRLVMRDDYKRTATDAEVAQMATLVEQGMREGAMGLSSGLEYEVGGYADTRELVALARTAARFHGIYMSHIRDEADRSFEALREAIAIGEQAHIPVQISHIKLGTVSVWRKAADAVRLIEDARKRGVDVTADCYPYNAWSSTITVLVPDKRYDYAPSVEKALADVGGAGNVLIVRHAAHPDYEFKTLDAVARARGVTPVEQFIQIVKDGGAAVVCTSMVDDDIRMFYQQPWVMVASDGGIGARHPRGAGTFPKVLGRYVRDSDWLTLPEAIRKMTSTPADRLHLGDRGRIAVGTIADLVLFNPATVIDRSTFSDPAALPIGVEKVFVAGELVWDSGKPVTTSPRRPGRVVVTSRPSMQ